MKRRRGYTKWESACESCANVIERTHTHRASEVLMYSFPGNGIYVLVKLLLLFIQYTKNPNPFECQVICKWRSDEKERVRDKE